LTYEQLANLLEATKGQIRAFDNKAQVLLGVNGVLVGFIAAEVSKAAEYGANGMPARLIAMCILLGVAFLSSCASMALALFVIHPQLHLAQPTSKFFFCHLARDYGRDFARASQDLVNLQEPEASLDVGTQIYANAVICDVKSNRCRYGMWFTGLALAGYALSLPVFCSMAYTSAAHPASKQAASLLH
jgi:hypothetical protein